MRLRPAGGAVLALLVFLPPAVAVRAGAPSPAPVKIPDVGRPADLPFSEAAGSFEVSASAAPVAVHVEEPVLLTLRVTARKGTLRLPPRRIDLNQLPDFAGSFFIDDPKKDTYDEASQTWEFVYRLKPRRTDVTVIPGIPFVYYDPQGELFQRPLTDDILLRVTPVPPPETPPRPVDYLFLQEAPPARVVARGTAGTLPGVPVLVVLMLIPPLGCLVWYFAWRRVYPDAARRVQQRRSRAAALALKQLEHLPRGSGEERAAHVAAAVTAYLQQRLDLPTAEPTPAEAAGYLRTAGCPDSLSARAGQFFRTCDAARFYPLADAADLPRSAEQLILDLEAHTWASLPQS
jgi:hypothetical protein